MKAPAVIVSLPAPAWTCGLPAVAAMLSFPAVGVVDGPVGGGGGGAGRPGVGPTFASEMSSRVRPVRTIAWLWRGAKTITSPPTWAVVYSTPNSLYAPCAWL